MGGISWGAPQKTGEKKVGVSETVIAGTVFQILTPKSNTMTGQRFPTK